MLTHQVIYDEENKMNKNNYNKYINDLQQSNLFFQTLSKKEKLKEYRSYLYIDLVKKLQQLEVTKKQLIHNYNQEVSEIDRTISEHTQKSIL